MRATIAVTACDDPDLAPGHEQGASLVEPTMIRWFLAIFVGLIVLSAALPWLEKIGLGRLPGDLRFRFFGKQFFLPFASTVLLSMVLFVVLRLIR